MKNLLFILLFVSFARSAITTVGQSGTSQDLSGALAACGNNDTVMLVAAADSVFTLSASRAGMNAGMMFMSEPGFYHKVAATITYGGTHMRVEGTGVRFKDIFFYYPSGAASGYNYFITAWNPFTVENCIFKSDSSARSTLLRGFILNDIGISSASIKRSIFWNIYSGLACNSDSSNSASHVVVDSCLFYESNAGFGHGWQFKNTIIIEGGEISVQAVGIDSVQFYKCWFDQKNRGNGEFCTWDGVERNTYGNSVKQCIFINDDHVFLMWDAWISGTVQNCLFFTMAASTHNIFNHRGFNLPGVDYAARYVQFINNTVYGLTNSSSAFYLASSDPQDSVCDISLEHIWFGGLGPIDTCWEMARDTIRYSIWQNNPVNGPFPTMHDNTISAGVSYLIDTTVNRWWHKQTSVYDTVGARGKLFVVGNTSAITDSSITWECTLDSMFRHDNEIYDTTFIGGMLGFLTKNSWITGDTATFYIDTSTDAATWGEAGNSEIIAGETVALQTDNLPPSTLFYIRQRVENSTIGVYDTSAIDSFTTFAASIANKKGHIWGSFRQWLRSALR